MRRSRELNGGRSGTADGPWSARSPRSATTEEGRLRWGDRGVATGRLWEPTAPNARLPQVCKDAWNLEDSDSSKRQQHIKKY